MVQLFEDYPVTESLLLWYPTLIAVAELTLPLIRSHVDKCVRQRVVFASTSFFMTLANLETWHFMILYDRAGLVAALFLLILWKRDYCRRSSSGSNPCALVVLYIKGQLSASNALALFVAQCVGVAAGFQAARHVWSVGLCEFHRGRALTETAERCSSSLSVWWPCGVAIEFVGALVNYVVWSTGFTTQRHRRLEVGAKSLVRSVAAVAMRSYTGFYLHPLSASMRTLGCGDTATHEHLFVYWVGAVAGVVAGVTVQPVVARTLGRHRNLSRAHCTPSSSRHPCDETVSCELSPRPS